MSAINKALSKLAEDESVSKIEQAHVPKVSSGKPWLWVGVGFSCSLALGGWALSSSPEMTATSVAVETSLEQKSVTANNVPSPTSKATPESLDMIAVTEAPEMVAEAEPVKVVAKPKAVEQPVVSVPTPKPQQVVETKPEPIKAVPKPVLVAQVKTAPESKPKAAPEPQVTKTMVIEQVELTPAQLADKAEARAKKALDANDMQTALSAYNEVIRYTPSNAVARQKLAALYFGKGDTRKAYETLQTGIERNTSDQTLRLALTKLLLKAKQDEAALSPLLYMPSQPDRDYLAMRAALAQKQQQNEIALESYEHLTALEPNNARWWLGLGIQQERAVQFSAAIQSYNNALGKVGVSNQSQAFIRDRLNLLKQLEGAQ